MLLLEGNSCREFALPLVLSQFFAVDRDRHRVHVRCVKETWDVIGDSHEVDGRRTSVLDDHVCLESLLSERT